MKKIDFLGGVNGEVTGSSYLLTSSNDSEILIDLGMFQGDALSVKKNYEMLGFHAATLQGVFITHGHLDHCGRLPLLVYGGYRGKIYMTAPTKSFVQILLDDSARIAEKDRSKEPLYTAEEVWKTMDMIEVVDYDTEIKVGNFTAIYRDAGHILGSSSIEIKDNLDDQKIVFSGDLGNTPQNIVKPTKYIDSADIVVMESTYGDSDHPNEDPTAIIQEEINIIEKSDGVLLIPVFAIERTQEILHIINRLKEEGKVASTTQVFLDSPMAIDVTSVYMNFKEHYNEEIQSHKDIPFNFDGLEITYDPRDSKQIRNKAGAKVIIAGSGMMSGGRILHHAYNYLPLDSTRVLFVGYQAEETLGRQVLEGAKHVKIDNESVTVRANIREIKTLSSHADQQRLMKWLTHIKDVKKVFLVHGENEQREALAEKIKTDLKITDITLPNYNDSIPLT